MSKEENYKYIIYYYKRTQCKRLFFINIIFIAADLESEIKENFKTIFELWKSGEVHNRIPFKVPPVEPLPMPPFCDNINKLGVRSVI